jgi:hypothetical protein
MGKIMISTDRFIAQSSGEVKANAIKKLSGSNKGSVNDIMNFLHFFKGFQLDWGEDGPEMKNGKAYLSVYHFLEYEAINPHDYDTFSIGDALSHLTEVECRCKFEKHDFHINKYEYSFLKQNMHRFNAFRNR